MNTIQDYVNHMFASLPRTREVLALKEDLLANMEEKYQDLKAEGKSENEAIGIVISEFGSIDELMEEMGISAEAEDFNSDVPYIGEEEALSFMAWKKQAGSAIGLGVLLCLLGIGTMTFVSSFIGQSTISIVIGIVAMFACIAIGVGLFIYAGVNLQKFEYLKKPFKMDQVTKITVQQHYDSQHPRNLLMIAFGVILCILSPIPVAISALLSSSEIILTACVAIFLFIVGCGVFFLVLAGNSENAFNQLLEKGEYASYKKTKSNKVVDAIAGVYWPLVVCAYLAYSFLTGDWGKSWIIWPISGVFFGAIAALTNAVTGHED